MSKHSLTALALVLLLLAAPGCRDDGTLPGQPNKKDRFVRPSDVSSFAKLYKQNCAGCHGEDGNLGAGPPLNDAIFLAIVPDKVLTETISAGRKGTEMPAFLKENGGTLTAEQVKILADGLRKPWGKEPPKDAPKKDTYPAYEPAGKGDVEQGKKVFAMACAGCHGADGKDGPDGRRSINDGPFLALSSNQVLRRYIITGRPDLDMPNCTVYGIKGREEMKGPLTTADVDDLMALIATWRK